MVSTDWGIRSFVRDTETNGGNTRAQRHSLKHGHYPVDGNSEEECQCGYKAESIKEHVDRATKLTLEELEKIDTSNHISYWCSVNDHCCCTDSDWMICNCGCHKLDQEERYCTIRLLRWELARERMNVRLNSEKA